MKNNKKNIYFSFIYGVNIFKEMNQIKTKYFAFFKEEKDCFIYLPFVFFGFLTNNY